MEIPERFKIQQHIFGNPFRTPVWKYGKVRVLSCNCFNYIPDIFNTNISQLSQSLLNGENCAFALADALEEEGFSKLGKHFREEEEHMKGCWALDYILRR